MKVGDKVQCLSEKSTNYKQVGEVTCIEGDIISVKYPDGDTGKGKSKYYKLTSCNPIHKVQSTIMGLTDKFLLGIKAEPQRSFRKAGITNGDDLLTSEGTQVFLAWLLKENEDAFKTEVVDPIIEEMKDEGCHK